MKNVSKFSWMFFLLIIPLIISCKKTTTEPDVIASFTFKVDAADFKKVAFTSAAQNYASLFWEFGDNTTSTEINPVHTYAAVQSYTVKLTAVSPSGVKDVLSQVISISDPNAELTKLVGETSKTWKLLRSVATLRYPLEVGPADHSTIWWAMGKDNDELAKRPCMLNDEWTFTRAGLKMDFDAKGDYWAEGGVFMPENICASTDQMLGPNGEDLSAWGSGSHTFVLTPGTTPTLQVVGLGAYLGLSKVATSSEVKLPQESVTYEIIKLTDGPIDTLIIQTNYMTGGAAPQPAYWRFVLMHYDNPADEPPIPGNKPIAAFTTTITGLTVVCANTSTEAQTYLWDFGDGTTSTELNPTHTYSGDGYYEMVLTATNANGSSTATQANFLVTNSPVLTDALLQGAAWKVAVGNKTVIVGPGMGNGDWWTLPKAFLTGGTGADDWTCMPDDQFTFGAGGVFTYNTMGSARNDGYMGTPNGCFSDAQIAASALGSGFGSATHAYTFTPESGTARATITLTNGTLTGGGPGVAFLGFYKGYNGIASSVKGGENNGADPANFGSATNTYEVMAYTKNATKEYLFVSVDISGAHDGSAAWSMILER
jgi:PKD repeat protein